MGLNAYTVFSFVSAIFFSLSSQATAAGLLEDGDDFSNNLVSDLAPLLALFYLHQKLRGLYDHASQNLGEIRYDLGVLSSLATRTIYKRAQRPGDIFDRSEPHHVMETIFIDHPTISGEELELKYGYTIPSRPLRTYMKCTAKSVKAVREIKLYPLRILNDLYSSIFMPLETFSHLLKNLVDLNSRNVDYRTPLHYVCILALSGISFENRRYYVIRDEHRVNALLLNKPDVNAQDLQGNTPLHFVVAPGRVELVRPVIDQGCNVRIANLEGRTSLHLAAMLYKTIPPIILPWLLEAHAKINVQDQAEQTPLHLATVAKQTEAIKVLGKHGARQDILDNDGKTVLMTAFPLNLFQDFEDIFQGSALSASLFKSIEAGAVESIGRLMEKMDRDSWPPMDESGYTPFYVAAKSGKPAGIARVIQKANEPGFDPQSILVPKAVPTALSIAANGGLDIVKAIMENVRPETRQKLLKQADHVGKPALFWWLHKQAVFSHLVDLGADMRTTGRDGNNLLHVAAEFSYKVKFVTEKIETILGLLVLKDMLGETNKDGRTPREVAERGRNPKKVEFLDAVMRRLDMLDSRE